MYKKEIDRLTGVKQENWKGLVPVRGTQAHLCHRAFICWVIYILEVKGRLSSL